MMKGLSQPFVSGFKLFFPWEQKLNETCIYFCKGSVLLILPKEKRKERNCASPPTELYQFTTASPSSQGKAAASYSLPKALQMAPLPPSYPKKPNPKAPEKTLPY